MSDELTDQARRLFKTIEALKASVLLRNAPANVGLECPAKDLTLPQMSTLVIIRDAGELSLKELAEAAQVSPPSASAMVDRLVDLEMVSRVPSQIDRREVRVTLTPMGETAVTAMESQLLAAISDLLRKLGPDYARQWCEVYARIHEILDAEKKERRSPANTEGRGAA